MIKAKTSKIISIAVFLLAVIALAYLITKGYILADNFIGIIIQVAALGLMLWARITFGSRSFHAGANATKGKLITNGPYKLLRHPIYASVIYFIWAGVLFHRFIDAFLAAILITLCLIVRMLLEEKFLLAAYNEYKAYCKHTFRLIPFIF